MKTLDQTLEELKQLEASLKDNIEKLTETQLEQIVNQLNVSFDLAQGELDKLEVESKIQFENIIHFDKKHYSENSNTKSYEFKLENLFKNLYE